MNQSLGTLPLEEGYMEVSVRYGNTCAAIRDCFASSTRAYLELCEVKDPSVKKEGKASKRERRADRHLGTG